MENLPEREVRFFTMKYPEDWSVKESESKSFIMFSPKGFYGDFRVSIGVEKSSLAQLTDKSRQSEKYMKDEVISRNNIEMLETTYSNYINDREYYEYYTYSLEHQGYGYVFSSGRTENSRDFRISVTRSGYTQSQVFENMLDSLQFLR